MAALDAERKRREEAAKRARERREAEEKRRAEEKRLLEQEAARPERQISCQNLLKRVEQVSATACVTEACVTDTDPNCWLAVAGLPGRGADARKPAQRRAAALPAAEPGLHAGARESSRRSGNCWRGSRALETDDGRYLPSAWWLAGAYQPTQLLCHW